jgi:hypothetical protein
MMDDDVTAQMIAISRPRHRHNPFHAHYLPSLLTSNTPLTQKHEMPLFRGIYTLLHGLSITNLSMFRTRHCLSLSPRLSADSALVFI